MRLNSNSINLPINVSLIIPDVLLHSILHVLTSAASPITEHLTAFCDSVVIVVCMSPGSHVVKLPIITNT